MKKISSIAVLILILTLLLVPMLVTNASAAEETATITFDDTSKRTTYTTSQQVWEENGITVTNNKASSTTNVGDYSNPARFYAKSELIIKAPGNIKSITVTCDSSTYATAIKNSVGTEATASSSVVTIIPSTSATSYTITSLSAQARVKSITVTYEAAVACEHANTTTTTTPATCTTAGSTTVSCNDCGETVSTAEIPATGHSYENGICTNENCGQALPVASFVVPNGIAKIGDIAADESGSITLPVAGTVDGYTFVGWSTTALTEETTTAPTVFNGQVTIDTDTTYYAIYSYEKAGESVSEYVLKDIGSITNSDVVVITFATSNGTVYAMNNSDGTSKAPSATIVTVDNNKIGGDPEDTIKWNIVVDGDNFVIYPNGTTDTWLYCTSTNNGVRVGTNTANTFTIDASSGYLKHTGTGRYLGVYTTTPDVRCYTTSTTTNIANQTLGFYVLTESTGAVTTYTSAISASVCAHENTSTTTIDATCSTEGSITVTCNDCGETISSTPISKLDHSYDEGEITTQPTCTEKGVKTYTCSECGDTKTEDVNVIAHTYVDGVCSVCGDEYTDFSGYYYIATIRTTGGNYWYMSNDLGTASTKRYQAIDSGLTTLPERITTPEDGYLFYVEKDEVNNCYYIYSCGIDGDENYLGWSSGNSGKFVAKSDAVALTIEETDGVYTIKFTDGSRLLALNNTDGNNYFAWYGSGQANEIRLIPASVCAHENQTTTTVSATCTEAGSVTVVCDDCGITLSEETIEALGHDYNRVVTQESTCAQAGIAELTCKVCSYETIEELEKLPHTETSEITKQPTCTENGTTTYTCTECGNKRTQGIDMIDHNFVDGTCTECGHFDSAEVDFSGKYYIGYLCAGKYYLITGNLGSNSIKRYQSEAVDKEYLPFGIFSGTADANKTFVIEKSDSDSTKYVIYIEGVAENNYLGWEEKNGGTLVSKENALQLTVEKSVEGVFYVYFVDDNGVKTYLALNKNTKNYAAWYAESSLQINDLSLIPLSDTAITGVSLNIGQDLSIRYHANVSDIANAASYSMRFTMNGKTVYVTTCTVENDKLVFTFTGIAPQCMGDGIKAELIKTTDGEETVVFIHDKYSVKQYAIDAFGYFNETDYPDESSVALRQLLTDMLYYGAAAQKYRGYKTDSLITSYVDGIGTPSTADFTGDDSLIKSIQTADGADTTLASFTAAGVRFDYVNKVYAKFKLGDGSDANLVSVTVGDIEAEILPDNNGKENVYMVYSDAISALEFGSIVEVKLSYNGDIVQTLTYTVNTYAYDKQSSSTVGELALALYNYGNSAVAYNNTKGGNE